MRVRALLPWALPPPLHQHCWPPLTHSRPRAAGEVYCIMANMGVDLLERQKRYKEAVQRLDMLLGGSSWLRGGGRLGLDGVVF